MTEKKTKKAAKRPEEAKHSFSISAHTSRAVASVAVCAAGMFSMWVTDGFTGIGWTIIGLLLIWGSA